MIVQLVRSSSDGTLNCHTYIVDNEWEKQYWEDGCRVKVPFCKRTFEPTCNCAALKIKNHNITKLADKFVELSALRNLVIESGSLKTLPKNMEMLKNINKFHVNFNHLQNFNVDVLQYESLNSLDLSFNNITEYNENLWVHPELVNLYINNNRIPRIPENVFLPHLLFLDVSNNTIFNVATLGSDKLPSIIYLYLNGNNIGELPDKVGSWKDTLLYLGVARCRLKSIEKLKTLTKLTYIDARNNSLTLVSDKLKGFIASKKNFESYFWGNPVCKNDAELNCNALCTDYCWSHSGFKNNVCDHSCNSLACDFDGGDCRQ